MKIYCKFNGICIFLKIFYLMSLITQIHYLYYFFLCPRNEIIAIIMKNSSIITNQSTKIKQQYNTCADTSYSITVMSNEVNIIV